MTLARRAGLGLGWLVCSAGALAQEAAPYAPTETIPADTTTAPPSTNADDERYRELPTIYVTAQKVRETLEEVPASVSTIDGNLIRDSGTTSLREMQNYAANVTLSLDPTSADFYIRGFGTAGTNVGFEPSVAAIVDGVYYGRSNFTTAVFFDLDRIEVLRGPQGTLFGKNSSAGVLNIVSVAPGPNFFTKADFLVDSGGRRSIEPAVNIPLGNDLAVRFSGAFAQDRGTLYNTDLDRHENGVEQATGRMRLRWEPSDAWFLDVGAFASRQSLNDNLFQLTHVGPNMLALMRTYDPEAEADGNNFHNSANVVARGIVTFKGANATYEHAADGLLGIDSLRFTSVTAYAKTVTQRRDFDADFSPVPVIVDTLAEPSPYRQISEELRFAGTHHSLFGLGGTFKFVIGGYYFDSHLASSDNFQLQDLGATVAYLAAARADGGANAQLPLYGGVLGNGGTLTELIDAIEPLLGPAIGQEQSALVKLTQHTSTNAAFGQAEWRVWRDVWFIGGVRVGHENKKGRASSQTDSRIIPLIAGQNNHDTPLHRSEREVSPKAGLKWQPNEAFSSYVTWSQGFKSGGFNALPLNDQNLEFDPEQATNVEGGIKGRFLGGSLSVTAAIYSTDFEDLQVSTFRGGNFIILNAARARSRGAEFDVRWLPPVNGTALIASMGLIRAHYTSYPNAPAPADSTNNPPVQDLTGERLAITPRYSASLIPSYSMTTPFLGGPTTFALDYAYRSGRYTDVDLDPRTYQSATHELGARVTFADEQGLWRVTLGAHNLTKEVVLEQVLDEPLAPGNFGATRGSDRGRFYSAVVTLAWPEG